MMLSHVEDWVVTKAWVAEHCTEGRNAVNCVFAELVELGYASVEQDKDTAGRFIRQVWTFRECSDRDGDSAQNPVESAETARLKSTPSVVSHISL